MTQKRSSFEGCMTALVTPFKKGAVDLDALTQLVEWQIASGIDGLVAVGTTGESATLTVDEHVAVIRHVVKVTAGRVPVIAGAGGNATTEALALSKASEDAGADALLHVTPYYNRPTQDGLHAHFTAVADATDLPVMLYDIPGRTGTAIASETLIRLADHPRIAAVKDAKGDLWAATHVLDATDLLWYSGDDVLTLAHLAQGAVGYVGVTTHVAGTEYAAMLAAVDAGDLPEAIALHRRLIPVVDAVMNTSQGAIMAKAALKELGVIDSAAVRLPLIESPPEHLTALRKALSTSGIS